MGSNPTLSANPLTTPSPRPSGTWSCGNIRPSGFPLIAEETTASPAARMPPAIRLRGALSARPLRTLYYKPCKFSEGLECYKKTECASDERVASQAHASVWRCKSRGWHDPCAWELELAFTFLVPKGSGVGVSPAGLQLVQDEAVCCGETPYRLAWMNTPRKAGRRATKATDPIGL